MRKTRILLGMAALAACSTLVNAKTADVSFPFEKGVDFPFREKASIDRFQDYLARANDPSDLSPTLPDSVWPVLPNIEYWGYRFENTAGGGARAYFIQRYNLDSLLTEASNALRSLDHNGCSFVHVGDVSYSVKPKLISFSAPMSGKQRACTDLPFGRELKTNIGDIDGSASGSIGMEVVDSVDVDKFHGKINPTDVHVSGSAKANSIFGININSVVGQFLKGVASLASIPVFTVSTLGRGEIPTWAVLHEVNNQFVEQGGSLILASQYLLDGGGAVRQKDYSTFLGKVGNLSWSTQPYWSMDATQTVFIMDKGHLTLQVAFKADVNDDGSVEAAIESAREEVDLLQSFSLPERAIVAVRGDSWWRLAKKHYRSGYLAGALAAYQQSATKWPSIRPGQALKLPPISMLSAIPDHYIAKPGDSFSALCRRWRSEPEFECVRRLTRLNPGSKRKLYALEAIRTA